MNKFGIMVFAMLLLGGFSFAANISACGDVDETSVLTANLLSNGTCLVVNKTAITLDCNGYSITGNTTGSGILVNASNVTVKNCIINNVARGIQFPAAGSYGVVINVSANGSSYGIDVESPVGASIFNSTLVSTGGRALYIFNSNNGIINNNEITSDMSYQSLYLNMADGWIVSNNRLFNTGAATYGALNLHRSARNMVANNTITGIGSGNKLGIVLQNVTTDVAANNTIINNTVKNFNTSIVVGLGENFGNLFYWNNLSGSDIYINDSAGGNYYNTTIESVGEGNLYENVLNGSVQITSYTISSYGAGWYSGEAGTGYPYSNSTSAGKVIGNATDYAPITPYYTDTEVPVITVLDLVPHTGDAYKTTPLNCTVTATDDLQATFQIDIEWYLDGANQTAFAQNSIPITNNTLTTIASINSTNLTKGQEWYCRVRAWDGSQYSDGWNTSDTVTILNSGPSNALIDTITNATVVGHWFTVNGSAEDADGASDIISATATAAPGTCVQTSNNSTGNTFSAEFNCTSTTMGTPDVNLRFSDGEMAASANQSNAYPDHSAALVDVPLLPATAYFTSTMTCGYGTWSDVDSDLENTAARTYRWFRNGSVIAGQTGRTLAPANFGRGDTLACEQSSVATSWTTSTASNISANVTVRNETPLYISDATITLTGKNIAGSCTALEPDAANVTLTWTLYNSLVAYSNGSTPANSNVSTSVVNLTSATCGSWYLQCGAYTSDQTAQNVDSASVDIPCFIKLSDPTMLLLALVPVLAAVVLLVIVVKSAGAITIESLIALLILIMMVVTFIIPALIGTVAP